MFSRLSSRAGLFAAAACVTAMVAMLWVWFWPGAIPSGTTSGVWSALAADLADGVFYRPLHEADGAFGGTRYLPLFFGLHAGLLKAGLDVVTSGMVLMAVSIALFEAALCCLLRQAGVSRWPAVAWALLVNASLSYQLVTLEVRADVLAAAGSLWAVWFAARRGGTVSAGALACVVAAFACKLTAVAGLVAIVGWHVQRGERRTALRYAAIAGVSMLAVLWASNLASDGRAWAAFRACISGGDTPGYAWRAPWWLALTLAQDPFLLVLLAAAIGTAWEGRGKLGWPGWMLAGALVTSVPLFASPGTGGNHWFESLAGSLLVLGARWQPERQLRRWRLLFGFIVAGCGVMWFTPVPTLRSFIAERGRPSRAGVERIVEKLGDDPRPLLSENPLLPLLMKQRPVVLDAFALRVIGQQQPAIAEDFNRRLEAEAFSAVILLDWSGAPESEIMAAIAAHDSPGVKSFYGEVHFPGGFLERLQAHYELGFLERPYVIFLPKGGGRAASR